MGTALGASRLGLEACAHDADACAARAPGRARTARNAGSLGRRTAARPSRTVRRWTGQASNPWRAVALRGSCAGMLLEGRKLLITGVLTDKSIAFTVARRAQEEGAEVILTGFGRGMRITERMAKRLPTEAEVLELDVNDPDALEAVAGTLDERWGRLDGLLHAIAFVPADALGGKFLQTPSASAVAAFETSAFSLKALAAAMLPLLERGESAGVVGLDFDASVAWPAYDWAGSPRPRWSRSTATSRATSVPAACAPTSSPPARCRPWRPRTSRASTASRRSGSARRPGLGPRGPSPVADACLFLLSRWPGRSPARSCTSTAACTRWGRRRCRLRPPTLSRPQTLSSFAATRRTEGGWPRRRGRVRPPAAAPRPARREPSWISVGNRG